MPSDTAAPNVSDDSLVKKRQQEAIEALKALSEADLKDRIVLPLFRKRGLKCTSVDRRHEGQHRCDILMESDAHQDSRVDGVQLKANTNILSKDYVREEIERASIVSLTFDHLLANGTLTSLSKYYWISTGTIDPIGNMGIKEIFGKGTPYFGRVEVWGVERLVDEIQKTSPDLLPPLELLQIEQGIEMYRKSSQGVFAAHCCYNAFLWHHRQPDIRFKEAEQCLRDALLCLDLETRKSLYYSRLLRRYYEGLLLLLREAQSGSIPWLPGRPLGEILTSPEAVSALGRLGEPGSAWLVCDVESIHHQSGIVLELFLPVPAPLLPVQICRFLLRFGYPPSEPALTRCLNNTEAQFEKEGHLSIDGSCSLCTATAVSCFSLAGDSERSMERLKVKPAVEWLETRKPFRYCYLEGRLYGFPGDNYSQHALHYAATVLTAFLDWGAEESCIDNVKDILCKVEDVDSQGFYLEWMLYRNEDRFEICRYILSAFLRYILVREALPRKEEQLVKTALERFVAAIYVEAKDTQKPAKFYAARTNLGSLILGAILHVEKAVALAREVAGVLHRRGLRANALWDGSAERTLAFLEGFLDYWETILFLEQRGEDVGQLFPAEAWS